MDKKKRKAPPNKAPNFEGFNITEREIRYAMANSVSNSDAARFLRITLDTYRKYARMFIDEATGLDLYALHKKLNPGKRREKIRSKWFKKGKELMDAVLRGEVKAPTTWQFKHFLLREGIVKEECQDCGFHEHRITDGSIPLQMIFLDGNRENGKRENWKLICYNCYYLQIGNIWGRPVKPKFDVPQDFDWK
jgi:hypothetical protein